MLAITLQTFYQSRAIINSGVPKGVRTPVTAVKGQCPRPLDDGDLKLFNRFLLFGGAKRNRTADLNTASVALYQLSYGPAVKNGHSTGFTDYVHY
jgi:hypothetical protein